MVLPLGMVPSLACLASAHCHAWTCKPRAASLRPLLDPLRTDCPRRRVSGGGSNSLGRLLPRTMRVRSGRAAAGLAGQQLIPAALRRRCGLRPGDRVLAALPGEDVLAAYPLAVVDQAIRAHHEIPSDRGGGQ